MMYRGVVRKGVVVLEKGTLREGTKVRVVPIKRRKSKKRKDDRIHPVGSWEGPPGEFERLLAEVQRMRDADLIF